jgi:hypothetical protein
VAYTARVRQQHLLWVDSYVIIRHRLHVCSVRLCRQWHSLSGTIRIRNSQRSQRSISTPYGEKILANWLQAWKISPTHASVRSVSLTRGQHPSRQLIGRNNQPSPLEPWRCAHRRPADAGDWGTGSPCFNFAGTPPLHNCILMRMWCALGERCQNATSSRVF